MKRATGLLAALIVLVGAVFIGMWIGSEEPGANPGGASKGALVTTPEVPGPRESAPAAPEVAAAEAAAEPEPEPAEPAELDAAGAGTAIAGRVVEPAARPVAGAQVELCFPKSGPMQDVSLGDVLASATSAEDGTFVLPAPDGADRAFVRATHPDFGRTERDFIRVDGGSVTVIEDLVLAAPSSLGGRVLDEQGNPIAGAEVQVRHRPEERLSFFEPPERVVRSGEDGRYRAGGLVAGTKDLQVRAAGFNFTGRTAVLVPPAMAVAGVDFRLARELTIAGRVTAPDGTPIAGAKVDAYWFDPVAAAAEAAAEAAEEAAEETEGGADDGAAEDGVTVEISSEPWGEGVSAADGTFVVRGLEPGQYELSAHADGFEPEGLEPLPAGAVAVHVILEPHPTLAGRVVDAATGAPVDRFAAAAARIDEDTGQPVYGKLAAFAAADGAFVLGGHSAGEWRVRVLAPGYSVEDVGPVHVEPAGPAAAGSAGLTVRLSRGSSVRGRVESAATGLPVAGVALQLKQQRGGSPRGIFADPAADPAPRARTGKDGSYVIEHVAGGSYRVAVADGRYAEAEPATVDVTGSGAATAPPLRVFAAGSLSGFAIDPSVGRAKLGVAVVAESALARRLALTGPDGRYRFERLPAGAYAVRILRIGEEETAAADSLPSGSATVYEAQESTLDLR